jgi:hypothetical protein
VDVTVAIGNGDNFDRMLEALEEFSIRYHPLGTTNAHFVGDLKIT